LVGPQSVEVRAGRSVQHDIRRRLIDVRFALQVNAAASHVSDADHRLEGQFPLHREVPVPRFRILEVAALGGYRKRKAVGARAARIVSAAEGNVGSRLERRIAAQEYRVADTQARVEAPAAYAQHSLLIDAIRKAETGLELTPADLREVIGVAAAAV